MRIGHHLFHDFSERTFKSVRRCDSMSARLVLLEVKYIISVGIANIPASSERVVVKASYQ